MRALRAPDRGELRRIPLPRITVNTRSSAVHRSIIAVRYTASSVALVKRESNEMAGSTPSTEDSHQDAAYKEEYELNLEMWRHYDNLRQEKSKTFLTAQTILIAVSGFVFNSQDLNSASRGLFYLRYPS